MTGLPTTFAGMKNHVAVAVILLLLAPVVVRAEPLQLFFLVEKENLFSMVMPERTKREPEHRLLLEVDEHGEVVMRQGKLSVILAYNSLEDAQRSQERGRDLQLPEALLLSGFCVKLSLLF
ncbi:MAG TPA: hypothetical protein VGJ93_05325 [Desulfuromonadaceae bacterium]|jgi:hypothetical protein